LNKIIKIKLKILINISNYNQRLYIWIVC